jgi:hypothetical protein
VKTTPAEEPRQRLFRETHCRNGTGRTIGAMRSLPRTTVLVAAVLVVLTSCSAGPGTPTAPDHATTGAKSAKPALTKPNLADNLLFVARSATATLVLDDTGKGTLKLETIPTMTWFSDRPKHDAGTTTTTDALKAFGWARDGDTLGKDAPNAALTADGLANSVVLELLAASRGGDDLTFKVATETKPEYAQRKQQLSNAELFIDSAGGLHRLPANPYNANIDKVSSEFNLIVDQLYSRQISSADAWDQIAALREGPDNTGVYHCVHPETGKLYFC